MQPFGLLRSVHNVFTLTFRDFLGDLSLDDEGRIEDMGAYESILGHNQTEVVVVIVESLKKYFLLGGAASSLVGSANTLEN